MHNKTIGKIGELAVAKDLMKKGYIIFTEFSDNSKIDLIAYNEETQAFIRVQVKTAGIKKNIIELKLVNSGGKKYRYRYTSKDVDVFALYSYELDKIAYIPIHIWDGSINLRFRIEKNTTACRSFCDYEKFPYELPNIKAMYCKNRFYETGYDGSDIFFSTKKKKINWPDADALHKLIWNSPTQIVAKNLGVSDTAVSKRCILYGIEKPPRGYWAILESSKKIELAGWDKNSEEFKNLLKTKTPTELGKEFSVDRSTIRKWISHYT